jgi:hypothetical protein
MPALDAENAYYNVSMAEYKNKYHLFESADDIALIWLVLFVRRRKLLELFLTAVGEERLPNELKPNIFAIVDNVSDYLGALRRIQTATTGLERSDK